MWLARGTRCWGAYGTTSVNDQIAKFVTNIGKPLVADLVLEINDAMKETSPVLTAFDLFNPDSLDKSLETRKEYLKTFCNHYGEPRTDDFEHHENTVLPVVNSLDALAELEGFIESMDEATMFLKEKVKKNVERLMNEGALKQVDVHHYTENEMPTACDVYKVLAADGSLKLYKNIATLFRISLLIPPSTSNVERGFSVMNLLCTPLRSSLSENNLDRFIRICINGPDTFSDAQFEEMVDIFKATCDNRRLDL